MLGRPLVGELAHRRRRRDRINRDHFAEFVRHIGRGLVAVDRDEATRFNVHNKKPFSTTPPRPTPSGVSRRWIGRTSAGGPAWRALRRAHCGWLAWPPPR